MKMQKANKPKRMDENNADKKNLDSNQVSLAGTKLDMGSTQVQSSILAKKIRPDACEKNLLLLAIFL